VTLIRRAGGRSPGRLREEGSRWGAMELLRWQELYSWAEAAAQAFFAEHFSDLCARCAETAETSADPSVNCCRRTNFFPEILTDPLLGGLAEQSLGHSLLILAGPLNVRACAALGPKGCRIPSGRPDTCYIYMCDAVYACLDGMACANLTCQLRDALEVFTRIRGARRSDDAEYQACVAQVEELGGIFALISSRIRERADAFADIKACVIREQILPPSVDAGYPTTS